MVKPLNILSTFSGSSTDRYVLDCLGIDVNYFSSEIDKFAIQCATKNYPDMTTLGDICKLSYKEGFLYSEKGTFEIGEVDLLVGGSPCQSFSIAGDGTGFDGKSGLFWEFVRLLEETKPKYFFLENVVMKKRVARCY